MYRTGTPRALPGAAPVLAQRHAARHRQSRTGTPGTAAATRSRTPAAPGSDVDRADGAGGQVDQARRGDPDAGDGPSAATSASVMVRCAATTPGRGRGCCGVRPGVSRTTTGQPGRRAGGDLGCRRCRHQGGRHPVFVGVVRFWRGRQVLVARGPVLCSRIGAAAIRQRRNACRQAAPPGNASMWAHLVGDARAGQGMCSRRRRRQATAGVAGRGRATAASTSTSRVMWSEHRAGDPDRSAPKRRCCRSPGRAVRSGSTSSWVGVVAVMVTPRAAASGGR